MTVGVWQPCRGGARGRGEIHPGGGAALQPAQGDAHIVSQTCSINRVEACADHGDGALVQNQIPNGRPAGGANLHMLPIQIDGKLRGHGHHRVAQLGQRLLERLNEKCFDYRVLLALSRQAMNPAGSWDTSHTPNPVAGRTV